MIHNVCRAIFVLWISGFGSVLPAFGQEEPVPYVLSPRVGEVIDLEERAYFGLFPAVEDFASAQFFTADSGWVGLRITTQTGAAVTESQHRLSVAVVEALREWIEKFESSRRQAPPALLAAWVQAPSVLLKKGDRVTVRTRDRVRYSGRVLYATDQTLHFWNSPTSYQWTDLEQSAKTLPYTNINQIDITRDGITHGFFIGGLAGGVLGIVLGYADGDDQEDALFFSLTAEQKAVLSGLLTGFTGAFVGGIIGAVLAPNDRFEVQGDGEVYQAIVPHLNKEATFSSQTPPELQVEDRPSLGIKPTVVDQKPWVASQKKRFHFSNGAGGYLGQGANHTIVHAFEQSGLGVKGSGEASESLKFPIDFNNMEDVHFNLDYNVRDRVSLGVTMRLGGTTEIIGRDYEYESFGTGSIALFTDYKLIPVHPLLVYRYELQAGVGVSYDRLSVSSAVGSVQGQKPQRFEVEEDAIGANLRVRGDYYISPALSVYLILHKSFTEQIDVPAVTYINPDIQQQKVLQAHTVRFSDWYYAIGLGVHL